MKANPNTAGDPTITPAEARSIMAKRAEREVVKQAEQEVRIVRARELREQLATVPDDQLQDEIQRRIRECGAA